MCERCNHQKQRERRERKIIKRGTPREIETEMERGGDTEIARGGNQDRQGVYQRAKVNRENQGTEREIEEGEGQGAPK